MEMRHSHRENGDGNRGRAAAWEDVKFKRVACELLRCYAAQEAEVSVA